MSPDTKPNDQAPTEVSEDAVSTSILASKHELLGQTLNGRYLIERELKRGGMGIVYLARDRQLHSRAVVVKVLLDETLKSEYVVQKFHQEIEALSRLDHPGIVGIIDAGEVADGKPFIVMQYVEGVTLRSVMNPEGMNLERAADLSRQIGRALAAAHAKGIFHRDLKPENIMLQDLGQGEQMVKIIDFGIAKVKDSIIAPSTALNTSPGTVMYMAPEQLSGRPVSAATDIYALGIVAYEMVTGRKPFNPETGFELLQMQQTGVRVKPADLRPSVTGTAQDVILKALSFDPHDRYEGAREFGDDLARTLAENSAPVSFRSKDAAVLPPTRAGSEETPPAKAGDDQLQKTIPAHFQPAQAFNPAPGQFGLEARSARKSRRGLVLGTLILILGGGAAVAAIWYPRSRTKPGEIKQVGTATARVLTYKLTVQRMRDGLPYQEPFESSGQEIFENGWKFRMDFSSPQAGYLYLLNEGPSAGGAITYNLLFPAPSVNSGSPLVKQDQDIQTGWVVFDEHPGVEKFWMVWAADAVQELEAVKRFVNDKDKGAVSDAAQSNAVRDFLRRYSASKPDIEIDRTRKESQVKANSATLVNLIELEHH
jgi:tRNA A-37 threonylcarbamoyl transferase component Bud32